MKIKKLSVAVSTALVLAYLPVHAEDDGLGGGPEVKLRGFGTVGVVRSTNSKADVMDNLSQPRGAGYSHKWDLGVDSKLAVQADAKFNEKLSASWQVMSQRQYDDTYRPQTEMAFAKLAATSDLSIRLGRLPAPLFMVSEYRKVGYVNPWVRQPNEVYFQVPYTSMDGGDIAYQFGRGDFTGNVQLAAGTMRKALVPNEGNINTLRGDNGVSLNFVGEYGPVTFRIGHSRTKNTYTGESLNSLYNGMANVAAYGNGSCGLPLTTTAATAAYSNGKCPGMSQSIYQTAYNNALAASLAPGGAGEAVGAGLQTAIAGIQALYPNLEYDSARNLALTSSDPKFATLQAGYKQVEQGVTGAAANTTLVYNATVAKGQGQILDSNSLKARASELYDQYAADKSLGTFTGFGLIIDPGTWLLQSEYTIRKTDSFLADTTGWYLTGGYRFGKVMPYISLSELRVDSHLNAPYLLTTQEQGALSQASILAMQSALGKLGAVPYAVPNSLSTGVDKTVQTTSYGQKNISLGVRWDAFKNAAIKFQWDRIDTSAYPRGTMQNYVHTDASGNTVLQGLGTDVPVATDPTGKSVLKTEFDRAQPLNVFSLAVDFVF